MSISSIFDAALVADAANVSWIPVFACWRRELIVLLLVIVKFPHSPATFHAMSIPNSLIGFRHFRQEDHWLLKSYSLIYSYVRVKLAAWAADCASNPSEQLQLSQSQDHERRNILCRRPRNPDSREMLWSNSRFRVFLQPVIDCCLYCAAQISFLAAESHNNCQSQSSLNMIW